MTCFIGLSGGIGSGKSTVSRLLDELGATIVTGGGTPDMPAAYANGYWVEPTIWTGLPEDSPIIKEEIFGP